MSKASLDAKVRQEMQDAMQNGRIPNDGYTAQLVTLVISQGERLDELESKLGELMKRVK